MLFKTIQAVEKNQYYFRIVAEGQTHGYMWANSKADAEKSISYEMLELNAISDYYAEQVFHSDGTPVRGLDKSIR